MAGSEGIAAWTVVGWAIAAFFTIGLLCGHLLSTWVAGVVRRDGLDADLLEIDRTLGLEQFCRLALIFIWPLVVVYALTIAVRLVRAGVMVGLARAARDLLRRRGR